MPPTTGREFGAVVPVPFPFTGQSQLKRIPRSLARWARFCAHADSKQRGQTKALSKIKRQITQLLDTFIECDKLKQRINAQEA